jgi:hypothetical protein
MGDGIKSWGTFVGSAANNYKIVSQQIKSGFKFKTWNKYKIENQLSLLFSFLLDYHLKYTPMSIESVAHHTAEALNVGCWRGSPRRKQAPFDKREFWFLCQVSNPL